jgi:hypothetical protein
LIFFKNQHFKGGNLAETGLEI